MLVDTVETWIVILTSSPEHRQRACARWPDILARFQALQPNRRWRRVSGPVSATIVVLLELGWSPEGPWGWVDPLGTRWRCTEDTLADATVPWHSPLEAVALSAERKLWAQASAHPHGQGLDSPGHKG